MTERARIQETMKLLTISILLLSILPVAGTDVWPQFRGPGGDGVAEAKDVPVKLDPGKNLKWRTPLPGKGWSSPVIGDGSIWLTSAVEVKPEEGEVEKLLAEDGVEPKKFKQKQIAKSIRLLVLEVDLKSGELKREIELAVTPKPDSIHKQNSYASPTPYLENGKLYAHFGTYGTYCVDTKTGETAWETRLPLEHGVGPGSSPFIYQDLLILICDGVDAQYVAALDKNTGDEIWRKYRPDMRAKSGDQKKSYCTPIVVTPKGGKPQLVCMGSQWLVSYEPATGDEIWKVDHGSGFSVVPRPVFNEKEQLVYISTGFGKPELWAIRPDGKGDITDSDKIVWTEMKRIPSRPSPLLVGDELYVITDGGIMTCFNAADGENHWTERVSGNYSSSPLLADGHIFVASAEGKVTALKPGTAFKVVAESDLGEQIMASPVALDGRLIVRSVDALYCFGE